MPRGQRMPQGTVVRIKQSYARTKDISRTAKNLGLKYRQVYRVINPPKKAKRGKVKGQVRLSIERILGHINKAKANVAKYEGMLRVRVAQEQKRLKNLAKGL